MSSLYDTIDLKDQIKDIKRQYDASIRENQQLQREVDKASEVAMKSRRRHNAIQHEETLSMYQTADDRMRDQGRGMIMNSKVVLLLS